MTKKARTLNLQGLRSDLQNCNHKGPVLVQRLVSKEKTGTREKRFGRRGFAGQAHATSLLDFEVQST